MGHSDAYYGPKTNCEQEKLSALARGSARRANGLI
jgi:hypothetical protein